MLGTPSSFFLDAVRPYPRGFRLAYLLMSVSIVFLEVVFHAFSAPLGIHDILILVTLCVMLSVAPWLGFAGDLLYVAVFAAMGAFSSSLAFPSLGVFLVAVVWIIRRWTGRAALLLTGYILLMFWQNGVEFFPVCQRHSAVLCHVRRRFRAQEVHGRSRAVPMGAGGVQDAVSQGHGGRPGQARRWIA